MGVYKRNDSWWIDYYVDRNRRREKIGPSKKLAEMVLKKRLVEIAEGKFLDLTKSPRMPLDDMTEKYLTWARANKLSWDRDELSIKHLLKHFGGMHLDDISQFKVEQYKSKRREVVKPATVNRELACLRHIFSKAIAWGLAAKNPVRGVKLFKEDNQRTRFLNLSEFSTLVSCCAEHLRPLVIVAFHTGMRKGELLNLKWADVDFSTGFICVTKSKSGKGRQIPMNKVVEETLLALRKEAVGDHVFSRPQSKGGGPLIEPRTGFERAVKRAGLRDVTFHTLRHSFGSHLAMHGKSMYAVQKLMGHATASMTERYSHLSPEHMRDVVKALETVDGHSLVTGAVTGGDKKAASH